MKTIKICVASNFNIESHCDTSLREIIANPPKNIQWLEGRHGPVWQGRGVFLFDIRNRLVSLSKDEWQDHQSFDFDYVLFVDADIGGFTSREIEQLINLNQPVVMGLYPSRHRREYLTGGDWKDGKAGVHTYESSIPTNTTDLDPRPINWGGVGFTLIHCSVFSYLPHPWFRHTVVKYKGQASCAGEDVSFCMLCEEHRIPIYGIPMPHLTHFVNKNKPLYI